MKKHENWSDVESISQDLSEEKESTWTISFENGAKLRFVVAKVLKVVKE